MNDLRVFILIALALLWWLIFVYLTVSIATTAYYRNKKDQTYKVNLGQGWKDLGDKK